MSKSKLKKIDYHQLIEDKLSEMLHSNGYNHERNLLFHINGKDGECDLIAFPDYKTKYALVFEVKRRNNKESRKKVREQLKKDNDFIHARFGKNTRCFNFFVYSSYEYETAQTDKAYTIEWLRGL